MKICLIYPPADHMISTNVPSAVDEITGAYPPLGLLYVAGAIERAHSHEVHVIDCVAEHLNQKDLEKRIASLSPDLVGIQTITFSIIDACNAAAAVKRIDKSIPVLMGGPHVNIFPNETMNIPQIDYLLLGEAENNILPFIEALETKQGLKDVPGVVFRDQSGAVVFGPPNLLIEDMDALPLPARHLLDPTLYSSVLSKGSKLTTIMSSRGCPAKCIFCDRPHLGKKFRYRSAKDVVSEMQMCCSDFGIDEFFFYDDTFTINRDRVFEICKLVHDVGLKASWDIRARISTVDKEVLKALKDAGCIRIHFGIESGSEKVLKIMKKGLDLKKARQVFQWCRELKIETLAYFMFGSPGEGPDEIQETFDFAMSIDCDYIHLAITTPFPGTELYRMGLESGLYKKDYWAEFAANPRQDFMPELWEENLSREQLISYSDQLYKKFYGRPTYIMRQMMKIRTLGEFRKKAKAGMRLLFK